jgi:chemotaxis protein MotB
MSVSRFIKKAQEIQQDHQARKRDEPPPAAPKEDESNWLVSYADMMTLLCGFFIMLFSMATLDQAKYEKAKESIAEKFNPGKYENPSKELAEFMGRVLTDAGIGKEALVQEDALGVSVVFQSSIFFDTLSSEVKPQGRLVMAKLIENLHARQTSEKRAYRIVVEGHTDSRPILGGTFPSNWELSSARAARVLRMFLERGFAADRMVAIGYADTHPEVPERTPAGGWDETALTRNRRVVLRILQGDSEAIPLPKHRGEAAKAEPTKRPDVASDTKKSSATTPAKEVTTAKSNAADTNAQAKASDPEKAPTPSTAVTASATVAVPAAATVPASVSASLPSVNNPTARSPAHDLPDPSAAPTAPAAPSSH